MQPTRQNILEYLQHSPGSSAADLSRYLEMTPANIRYHLAILLKDGLVQISGQRLPAGAGRPLLLYNLTPEYLGESLLPLLRAILDSLEETGGVKGIAKKMAGDFSDPGGSPVNRYNLAVEHLNGLNYHASWQADPAGPRVALRHCPYRDLALTHPRICQIDRELVSILFNTPLDLTRRRNFGKNPFSPCLFSPASLEGEKG